MRLLVAAAWDPAKVAAFAETAPVAAVVRERAVYAPAVVKDVGVVAWPAVTAPADGKVVPVAARTRAFRNRPETW